VVRDDVVHDSAMRSSGFPSPCLLLPPLSLPLREATTANESSDCLGTMEPRMTSSSHPSHPQTPEQRERATPSVMLYAGGMDAVLSPPSLPHLPEPQGLIGSCRHHGGPICRHRRVENPRSVPCELGNLPHGHQSSSRRGVWCPVCPRVACSVRVFGCQTSTKIGSHRRYQGLPNA